MPAVLTSRRRWLRFSLRTLFVAVMLIAVWFGYYVNWMSQRREARAWLGMQMIGGSFGFHPKPPSAFPWMLKMLGEKPEQLILMRHGPSDHYLEPLPSEYVNLVKRVERLFPEAFVWDVTQKPEDEEDEQNARTP
jgi:hypothetical protein